MTVEVHDLDRAAGGQQDLPDLGLGVLSHQVSERQRIRVGIGAVIRPLEHGWTPKGALGDLRSSSARVRGRPPAPLRFRRCLRSAPSSSIIVLVIVLLIFGPKRLPGLGRQLGTGMREFKDGITGKDKDETTRTTPAATPRPRRRAAPAQQVPRRSRAPQQPQAPEQPAAVAGEQPAPDAPRSEG